MTTKYPNDYATVSTSKSLTLNSKQAEMIGEFIATTHRQLQRTANTHRRYHPTITEAAHEYMNETHDLLRQMEMDHLIMPRHMRPVEDQ